MGRDHIMLGMPEDGLANVTLAEMGSGVADVRDRVKARRAASVGVAAEGTGVTGSARCHLRAAAALSDAWLHSHPYVGDEHLVAVYLEDWSEDRWRDLPADLREGLTEELLVAEVLRDAGIQSTSYLSTLKHLLHGNW